MVEIRIPRKKDDRKPGEESGRVGRVEDSRVGRVEDGRVGRVESDSTLPTLPANFAPRGVDDKLNETVSGQTTPTPPKSGGRVGRVANDSTLPTLPSGYVCEWAVRKYIGSSGEERIKRKVLVCAKPSNEITTADFDNVYHVKTFDIIFIYKDKTYSSLSELRKDIGKEPTNEEITEAIERIMNRVQPISVIPLEKAVNMTIYDEIAKDPIEWLRKKFEPLGNYRFRQALAVILSGVSSLLPSDYRLHTVHSGLSRTGKSTTIRLAGAIFPPVILQDQYSSVPQKIVNKGIALFVSYVTPKALVYLKIDWSHKVLIVDQIDNPEDIMMLRLLMTNRLDRTRALSVQGEHEKITRSLSFIGDNPAVVFTTVLRNFNAKSNQTYNRVLIVSYDELPTTRSLPNDLFTDDERFAFLLWLKHTPTPVLPKEIEEKIDKEFSAVSMMIKSGVLAVAKLRGHAEVTLDDYVFFANTYRTDITLSKYMMDLIDIKILRKEPLDIPLDEYELRVKNMVNARVLVAVPMDEEGGDISFVDKNGNRRTYILTSKANDILDELGSVVPTEVVKEARHELDGVQCDEVTVRKYFASKGYPNANVRAIMKSWGCK